VASSSGLGDGIMANPGVLDFGEDNVEDTDVDIGIQIDASGW